MIKANGDIELGVGEENLKRLVTEDFMKIFNNHAHNYVSGPVGTFATTTPKDANAFSPTIESHSDSPKPPLSPTLPMLPKDLLVTKEHFTKQTKAS